MDGCRRQEILDQRQRTWLLAETVSKASCLLQFSWTLCPMRRRRRHLNGCLHMQCVCHRRGIWQEPGTTWGSSKHSNKQQTSQDSSFRSECCGLLELCMPCLLVAIVCLAVWQTELESRSTQTRVRCPSQEYSY